MKNENWKDIPGYEGRYQASDLGRIKSLPFMQRFVSKGGKECWRLTKEKLLALHPQNGGYPVAHLYLDDVRTARTVHRIVAELFIPNPFGLSDVNHRDGVKANCAASNLEWCTRSQNLKHAVAAGLVPSAMSVTAPSGRSYPSVNAARIGERVRRTTARKWAAA